MVEGFKVSGFRGPRALVFYRFGFQGSRVQGSKGFRV